MWAWFKRLFWKRCFYCGEKKEFFYFTWELPGWERLPVTYEKEAEVCTECVRTKNPKDL